MQIMCFEDFIRELNRAGFSMGGGNPQGIYSVIGWDWNEEPPYETPVKWHTGDKQTDPWEWRIRLLQERADIAYGKVFFKKSGYITRKWYPYFLAARRENMTLKEAYVEGKITKAARTIYECVSKTGTIALHELKQEAGFGKEEKAVFDRSLTELQMNLFITIAGSRQKVSMKGEAYGWSSTVFSTTEQFWGKEVFEEAAKIGKKEAIAAIAEQVYALNPQAQEKAIYRFIGSST